MMYLSMFLKQDNFTGTDAVIVLSQSQWSIPERYGCVYGAEM